MSMPAEDILALPVRYRDVDLNTVAEFVGGGRRGILLEEFDFSAVQGVGYVEKRAQDDGYDASDVYLGMRFVRLAGTIYGVSPGDVQDILQVVRTIFTPTVAYAEDIPHYGYLPLEFIIPTNQTGEFPSGYRDVELRARPRAQPQFNLRRDSGAGKGAEPGRGGGIMWSAVLECRDPRIYLRPPVWKYFTAGGNISITNRGDYPAPLDVLLDIPANLATSTNSYVDITVGGNQLRLKVPQSTSAQVLRYSGSLKVVTLEVNNVESLRMDLRQFINNSTNLTVPHGTHTVVIARANQGAPLGPGTRLMFSESFA